MEGEMKRGASPADLASIDSLVYAPVQVETKERRFARSGSSSRNSKEGGMARARRKEGKERPIHASAEKTSGIG